MAEEKRFRAWVFTVNNYADDDENAVFAMTHDYGAKYVSVGREVGESGTPHLQGYVYFKEAKTMSAIKRILPTAHFEVARSLGPAIEYTQKDGDFFEDGVRPMSQDDKGVCGKRSVEERWELAKKGRFEELPPEHLKIYQYIYRTNLKVSDRGELDNLWIWGPSGCGKSRYVRDNHPVFYTKGMNKWWDGYNNEDVVLLDDFDPKHGEFLGYFLKIWADHYAFNAEVKGGMLNIRPKKIIVTSQYPIEACFRDPEEVAAITRRFTPVRLGYPSQQDGAPGGVI